MKAHVWRLSVSQQKTEWQSISSIAFNHRQPPLTHLGQSIYNSPFLNDSSRKSDSINKSLVPRGGRARTCPKNFRRHGEIMSRSRKLLTGQQVWCRTHPSWPALRADLICGRLSEVGNVLKLPFGSRYEHVIRVHHRCSSVVDRWTIEPCPCSWGLIVWRAN